MKKDQIVQIVKKKFEERSRVGINKYDTTLFDSPDGMYTFLTHLQEELMDATLYCEKLKQINSSDLSTSFTDSSWNCVSCGALNSGSRKKCGNCNK
jgi:hypothetical protein|tara:strand:+ start:3117 stop:3404 length:288 start_codon:yes stop_codon:yes gene_type:complete